MKIEVEDYGRIREMYEEGKSQRSIARELHISRKTVKKYCEGKQVPWERKAGSGKTETVLTEKIKDFIAACINEDSENGLKKQKHTARRIYGRLKEELGFTGGESTVRRYTAELRTHAPHTFIPLEYSPGEAIQVDWGECTVYISGEKVKINLWCMRECYSGDMYCKAFYRQNQESFLEGMRDGLMYFGGVPKKVIFDNAKVAVCEGFGVHAKATTAYSAFAAHYAFTPVFCNIASGHEKGLVEGLVGFARRNYFVPIPRVNNIEELDSMLNREAMKYRGHTIDGQTETVGARFETSRKAFRMLPPYAYDTADTREVRVDSFSLVKYDGNKYSVPFRLAGQTVTVKATGNRISVVYRNETVATYVRDYTSGKKHYNLQHYIGLIEHRPRSAIDAAPVKHTVPKPILDLLEKQTDPHVIVKILQLYLQEPAAVLSAVGHVSNYEALEAYVKGCTAGIERSNASVTVTVTVPELSAYNCLPKGVYENE